MPSRKRAPGRKSTETTTAVTEPPAADTPTAVAEPPAPETNGNGQSFADRVGHKKWVYAPDPFGIATDYQAGVRLFESKQDRQMAIKFEDKPSQAVIDAMKGAGYRWNPSDRIWAHPVWPESAMSTRIDAERLYQQVCKMIRLDKGIEAGPEMSR